MRVPCIPPPVKLDHVSLAWLGSKGQRGGCSWRAQTVPAMARADHAPCRVLGCGDASTKSEVMSSVERLHRASEMAPNKHPETRSPGRGSRDVSAALSQGRGWHTALCHGSAGEEPKLRGRTEGLEANCKVPGRCPTGGEAAGAVPASPAHGTPVALGGGGRTSHWWESTSTAQETKLDTPTCSTEDLEVQHVPSVSHVQLLLPEDLCPMDHVNSDTADSGRFLVEKIIRSLIPLGKFWWSSLFWLHSQNIMIMQRMLQTQKEALQKKLAEKPSS